MYSHIDKGACGDISRLTDRRVVGLEPSLPNKFLGTVLKLMFLEGGLSRELGLTFTSSPLSMTAKDIGWLNSDESSVSSDF